jgi:hypothetical protein
LVLALPATEMNIRAEDTSSIRGENRAQKSHKQARAVAGDNRVFAGLMEILLNISCSDYINICVRHFRNSFSRWQPLLGCPRPHIAKSRP